MRLASLLLAAAATAAACSTPSSTDPGIDDAELRILFVGNSLTYTNDLPGVVRTLAEAAGRDVAVGMVAYPNVSLEDHWALGLEVTLREQRPDVVVMQQGPSSLPANQEHLARWAATIDGVVRDVGGRSALLMVWPGLARDFAFDDVRDAYHGAADAVGGVFIPAGEALRALHAGHPELTPYMGDGFHPSEVGTVLAAYVVAATLFDVRAADFPASVQSAGGGPNITLDEATADVLQAIADSVVTAWR